MAPLPAPREIAPSVAADVSTPAERLDTLFEQLRREPDAAKAGEISTLIQAQWLQSGSATIDLLMSRAAEAAAKKETAAALDLLDQTIVLSPGYAEGWNRRATVNYSENRYDLSMADVEETLRREPRHFAALTGLATMQEELGQRRRALATYLRVLAIYPALKEAQDAALRLSDELAGERA
ncbi:hypothetical protein [Aureimonas sp. AU12]|uniref:hypothetical protein n=1 Tax=Aureimonas sp. AU12 TaxID=1638161 RepID=UPI000784BE8D|nr:hypothetical protein [Aureimonas sp. AU12]